MYSVRNLARSPETKTIRAQRNGRWTGFLLDNGTRIRRKGARGTEIDHASLMANLADLTWGVEDGYIEVLGPDGNVIPLAELKKMQGKGPVQVAAPPVQAKAEAPVEVKEKVTPAPEPVQVAVHEELKDTHQQSSQPNNQGKPNPMFVKKKG